MIVSDFHRSLSLLVYWHACGVQTTISFAFSTQSGQSLDCVEKAKEIGKIVSSCEAAQAQLLRRETYTWIGFSIMVLGPVVERRHSD